MIAGTARKPSAGQTGEFNGTQPVALQAVAPGSIVVHMFAHCCGGRDLDGMLIESADETTHGVQEASNRMIVVVCFTSPLSWLRSADDATSN